MRLFVILSALFVSLSAYAGEIFVSAAWLKAQPSSSVMLYDVRSHETYMKGHYDNAINFPLLSTYEEKQGVFYVKGQSDITDLLQSKGITNDKTLVIADNGMLMEASRMYWVLELYGLKNMKILTGDFKENIAALGISSEQPIVEKSQFSPAFNAKIYADARVVNLATLDERYLLIDARTPPEYRGEKSATKVLGRIPTAQHFNMAEIFDMQAKNITLRQPQQIERYLEGFDKSLNIVTYCNKGDGSGLAYTILKDNGFNVSHYDGSWLDWTQRNLPVEN